MHAVIKMTVQLSHLIHPQLNQVVRQGRNSTESGLTITSVMVSLEGTTVRPQQISQR